MLMISRRPAEGVCIGDDIRVVFLGFRARKILLGIQAPRGMHIHSECPHSGDPHAVWHGPSDPFVTRLQCEPGSGVWIGSSIQVVPFWVNGKQLRIGIQAPDEIEILRDELVGAPAGQGHARPRQSPVRAARGVPLLMQGKGGRKAAFQGS
jgi:sRNA-binding carbon storage regulator CsrA